MRWKEIILVGVILLVAIVIGTFILTSEKQTVSDGGHGQASHGGHGGGEHDGHDGHGEDAGHKGHQDATPGPKGGRMFHKGDFQLEVTLFEAGVPPEFRIYAYSKGKKIPPEQVKLKIYLHRLGNRVTTIRFSANGNYLMGDQEVKEPHSFIVKIKAQWKKQIYRWEYSEVDARAILTEISLKKSAVSIKTAGSVQMKSTIEVPGQITMNPDNVAHILPRVSGIAKRIYKNIGDRVKAGEVIAILNSPGLAEAQREYLTWKRRYEAARQTYSREKYLWEKRVSAEQDYLLSRQKLDEAKINMEAASQKLSALGISRSDLGNDLSTYDTSLTQYEIRSPFDGTIIERHITTGEAVQIGQTLFKVVDLSTVWVDTAIYTRDLNKIRVGQSVTVKSKELNKQIKGKLSYISPMVNVETRTAEARVVLANRKGQWRPGLFVTVEIVEEEKPVPVAVPPGAIQTLRDWSVVFVKYGDVFEARPLKLGRRTRDWVEVLEGLSPGEQYAASNSFIIKAEIGKATASHQH